MRVEGVIMPFPGGIARSGSKVGSRYSGLTASTNDASARRCAGVEPTACRPTEAVFEIVIDGLALEPVREMMRRGLAAAAEAGASHITAGDYGGNLGRRTSTCASSVPMTLTLALREQPEVALETEALTPDRLGRSERAEIKALRVGTAHAVGGVLAVAGSGDDVRVEGDF